MVSLTIRDVPDDVRDELAARLARHGQSMQEYVRAALGRVVTVPDQADVLDRARRRARTLPPVDVDAVLNDFDADRR